MAHKHAELIMPRKTKLWQWIRKETDETGAVRFDLTRHFYKSKKDIPTSETIEILGRALWTEIGV